MGRKMLDPGFLPQALFNERDQGVEAYLPARGQVERFKRRALVGKGCLYAIDYIPHIGVVPHRCPIAKDGDLLTPLYPCGEEADSHSGLLPGPIDSEEAQGHRLETVVVA